MARPMPPYADKLHAMTAPSKSAVAGVLNTLSSVGGGALSLLSGLLSACLILYSSYVLYDTSYTQNKAFATSWDLLQYRPEIIEDGATPKSGAAALAGINADYRAWLTMYDTKIDYPVMQGSDDLYYSSHDIYGKTSLTGSIYLAAGSAGDFSDNYSLIYGHHMDNNAMFGGLDKYEGAAYFNSHREGILVTKSAVYDLQTFAVVRTDAYESKVYTVGDRDLDDLKTFIRTYAMQLDEAVMQDADQIVVLSTCRDAETSGRLVVFCRMTLREDEEDDDDDDEDDEVPPAVVPPETPSQPAPPTPPRNPTTPGGTTNEGDGGDDIGGGSGGETEVIEDPETPLAQFIANFQPSGSVYGRRAWALVNLISLLFTAYILLPLLHIKAKYSRGKAMKRINEAKQELREAKELQRRQRLERERIERLALENRSENASAENAPTGEVTLDEFIDAVETLYYQVKTFVRRFRIGIAIEVLDVVLALIAFILTEDMRLPMVLIDKWTPLMLFFLILTFAVDVALARYRKRVLAEEEEDIRERAEEIKAAAN